MKFNIFKKSKGASVYHIIRTGKLHQPLSAWCGAYGSPGKYRIDFIERLDSEGVCKACSELYALQFEMTEQAQVVGEKPWETLLKKIDKMLQMKDTFGFAFVTLHGIRKSILEYENCTPGQERAVANIFKSKVKI